MCIAKALFLQEEDRATLVTCFQGKALTKLLSEKFWRVNGKQGIPNPSEGGQYTLAELSTLTLNWDQALYLAKD